MRRGSRAEESSTNPLGSCEPDSRTLNPYASPQFPCRDEPVYLDAEYAVVLQARGWAYRRLLVSGPCPCVVEYDGRGIGYESVYVNGELATRVQSRLASFAPRLDFFLSVATEEPLRESPSARIEVETTWLMFIGSLRLIVGNRVVYAEGRW